MRALLVAFLLLGCSVDAQEPCQPVACEFYQGGCNPDTHVYEAHMLSDDGHGCWIKTAVCYPKGTPDECVPADCYEERGLGCAGR